MLKALFLFCLAVFSLIFDFTNADAAITWKGNNGAAGVNWSVGANWVGNAVPASTDDVLIPNTTNMPTVNAPFTCKSLTFTGATTLTLAANLTVTGAINDNSNSDFTITASSSRSITAGAASAIQSSMTLNANVTFTCAAAYTLQNSASLTVSANAFFTVTGNFTSNGDPIVNSGTINIGTSSTATTYQSGNGDDIINWGTGTFNITNCTLTTNGLFFFTYGTVNFNAVSYTANNGDSIFNLAGATFTANNNSFLLFPNGSSFFANISNDGTFNAGTSGSMCTISLTNNSSQISNTGTFSLGSTSIIITNSNVSAGCVSNTGTFIIRSDVNGSGQIGRIFIAGSPFSGTYNVERYLSGSTTSSAYRGYRLLSSPVATTATSGFYSINYLQTSTWLSGPVGGGFDYPNPGNPTIYLYRDNLKPSNLTFTSGNFRGVIAINVGSSLYTIVGDGNRAIYTGNGFLFYDRGSRTNQATKFTPGAIADPTTLTAIGTLNSGTIAVRLWFTASGLDYTSVTGNSAVVGFALVGNPYASSINWDTSTSGGITSTNVGLFTYTLMAASKNYNVYKANTALGAGTIVSTGSNIIPSGQGFFVKATGNSPKLSFTEAAKTTSQATAALGNSLMGTPVQAAVTPLLHLMLSQDTINKDGILILFDKNAKMQYDSTEDARYLKGEGTVSLSAMSSDSVRLAINSTPFPKLTPEIIPLAVNASADGRYQLNMVAAESIPDLFQVWLMDAYKKDSLDIKHNPLYTFDISGANAGSFGKNRFSLVIRQDPALGVHLLNFTATKITSGAQVVWGTENEQNYTNFTVERSTDGITFQVLDGVSSSAQGTYSFLDKSPAEGTDQYRLKIIDLNGTVSYSKIATLMYGNTSAIAKTGIELYPNPAKGPLNLAINPVLGAAASNSANSIYNIKIVSSTGAIIQNTTTNSANWQTDVSGLVPGTYVVQVSSNNSLIGNGTFIKL